MVSLASKFSMISEVRKVCTAAEDFRVQKILEVSEVAMAPKVSRSSGASKVFLRFSCFPWLRSLRCFL